MRNCPHCKKYIGNDSTICGHCGTNLKNVENKPEVSPKYEPLSWFAVKAGVVFVGLALLSSAIGFIAAIYIWQVLGLPTKLETQGILLLGLFVALPGLAVAPGLVARWFCGLRLKRWEWVSIYGHCVGFLLLLLSLVGPAAMLVDLLRTSVTLIKWEVEIWFFLLVFVPSSIMIVGSVFASHIESGLEEGTVQHIPKVAVADSANEQATADKSQEVIQASHGKSVSKSNTAESSILRNENGLSKLPASQIPRAGVAQDMESKTEQAIFKEKITDLFEYVSEFRHRCRDYSKGTKPTTRDVFETDEEYSVRCRAASESAEQRAYPEELVYFVVPFTFDYCHETQSLVLKLGLELESNKGKSSLLATKSCQLQDKTYQNVFGASYNVERRNYDFCRVYFGGPPNTNITVPMAPAVAREKVKKLSVVFGMRFVLSSENVRHRWYSDEGAVSFDNRCCSSTSSTDIDGEIVSINVINNETKEILPASGVEVQKDFTVFSAGSFRVLFGAGLLLLSMVACFVQPDGVSLNNIFMGFVMCVFGVLLLA